MAQTSPPACARSRSKPSWMPSSWPQQAWKGWVFASRPAANWWGRVFRTDWRPPTCRLAKCCLASARPRSASRFAKKIRWWKASVRNSTTSRPANASLPSGLSSRPWVGGVTSPWRPLPKSSARNFGCARFPSSAARPVAAKPARLAPKPSRSDGTWPRSCSAISRRGSRQLQHPVEPLTEIRHRAIGEGRALAGKDIGADGQPMRQISRCLDQVGLARVDAEGELKRPVGFAPWFRQVNRGLEQVSQAGRAGGILQERTRAENLLQRAQRRSVIIAVGADVAVAFGQRGKQDQADRPAQTAARSFVPGDEERAVVCPGFRPEDSGKLRRHPEVAVFDAIGRGATAGVVAVVAKVGDNEVVAGDAVAGQIRRQFLVRPDMAQTVWGIGNDIGEINKRIVVGRVEASAGGRTIGSADVLHVSFP